MTPKYKLVPIEPTREMWEAARDAVVSLHSQHSHAAISEVIYKAMLTAVPVIEQAPEVAKLVEALERISNMDSMSYHSLETAKIVAKRAVTAYHKQRGEL